MAFSKEGGETAVLFDVIRGRKIRTTTCKAEKGLPRTISADEGKGILITFSIRVRGKGRLAPYFNARDEVPFAIKRKEIVFSVPKRRDVVTAKIIYGLLAERLTTF